METIRIKWLEHEIWFNGFNYFIKDKRGKKSRAYDELWYCKRAIELNNIEFLESKK